MATNRNRIILANQKARQLATRQPQPLPELQAPPKLTAEDRKAIYAPKSALAIIPNRPAMPVRVVKTSAKATGLGLGIFGAILGGILWGESKTGIRM